MKLNLEFIDDEYKDNISINDSKIIEKYFSENEVIYSDDDLELYLLFSKNRNNIIKWYEFEQPSQILDLNPGFGELDKYLSTLSTQLDIISESRKKADAISKQCLDCDNVELYVGNINKIQLNKKYDYIIIIGDIDKDALKEKLKYAKSHLNKNGKILLSFDNKIGIKYWTGVRGEFQNQYYSIAGNTRGVGLHDAQKYINRYNLKYKLYFPMPDYKITNVIFSENKLPDYESVISRNLEYYSNDEHANFSQSSALVELIKDNPQNFYSFSNSYFFEIGKENIQNDIKYVNFEVLRKDEYHIKTTMKDKYVYKTTNLPESITHIQQIKKNIDIINKYKINTLDKYENDTIMSKISKEETLDKVLNSLYKDDKIDEMYDLFDDFINNTIKKLEIVDNPKDTVFKKYGVDIEEEADFHYAKYGLIDLVTQNTFYVRKKFYIYDQEWMEENTPIEYIIYRNILYNVSFGKYGLREELYKKYGIERYITLFRKLDDIIQDSIREKIFWKFYYNSVNNAKPILYELKDELSKKSSQMMELEQIVASLNERNRIANERADKFENNLRIIEASLSWKITKPLRYISWKLRQLKRKFDGRK